MKVHIPQMAPNWIQRRRLTFMMFPLTCKFGIRSQSGETGELPIRRQIFPDDRILRHVIVDLWKQKQLTSPGQVSAIAREGKWELGQTGLLADLGHRRNRIVTNWPRALAKRPWEN